MSSLATQYFLKAKENYPWDLAEAMQSLEYALSYDDQHAGVHCLLGRFYADQLNQYQEAFYHFEQALVHDINYIETYYHYSMALINYGSFDRAMKLLDHAKSIQGTCEACLLERKALIYEKQGKLCKAEKLLKKAIAKSTSNSEIAGLTEDLSRVKKKNKTS